MWEDPIVNEVRHIREELAEQCNFDVGAIFAKIRAGQGSVGKRIVNKERQMKAKQGTSPDRFFATPQSGR